MIYEERKEIYQEALDKWGASAQINMAIEEMSELTKELCKRLRGFDNDRALAEEMADVMIMMEQMQLLFENTRDIYFIMDRKCNRLADRLKEAPHREWA